MPHRIGFTLHILDLTGVTSGSSGTGSIFDLALANNFTAHLRGSTSLGNSLTVTIEDSADGGVTWHTWVSFTPRTAAGDEVIKPSRPPLGDVRVSWSVAAGGANPWDLIRVDVAGDIVR